MSLDTEEMWGACGEDTWKEHTTAARTSGHGVICCLKKFLAGTTNITVRTQLIMLLRPHRYWVLAWLTDSTTVQWPKMFLYQLCKKIRIQHMTDGLGVRIYNVRNYRSYVSWMSGSQGLPVCCLALNKRTTGWLMNHPIFKKTLAKICSVAYVWHGLF